MYFTNFLPFVLSVCLIAKGVQCDYTDDPPATNDELYGPNMCCYFAIGAYVDINEIHKDAPNAKKFTVAHLPKHKLGIATHPDPEMIYITVEDDENWDLYGVVYLIPAEEYKTFVKTCTMYKNKRVGHAVKESVVATLKGKTTNLDCIAFRAAGQEAKTPCKSLIEWYGEIFTAAGFPPNYTSKVAQLPTNDSC